MTGSTTSLPERFNGITLPDEPLGPRTWLKVGGPAQYLVRPTSQDELVDVVEDIVNDEEEERQQDEYDDNDNDLELERHFLEVGSSLLKLLSPYNANSDDGDLVPLSDQEDDNARKTNKNMNKK